MKNIIRVSEINLRNKKTGSGPIIHFMALQGDDSNYYPYINIYSFKDKSDLHKHYIITIEGKLEIAHNTYRKNWNNMPMNNPFDIESIFITKLLRQNVIDNRLLKYVNLNYLLPYELCSKYMYLISNAIKDYVDNNPLECMLFHTLINIINNADSLNIPESNMNDEKESIVKVRKKKLVLDEYDE